MINSINKILQDKGLPTIDAMAEKGKVRMRNGDYIAFQLSLDGCLPISIDIQKGLILQIQCFNEPWIEASTLDKVNLELLISIFTDIYVLEKIGGKPAYLHFFDNNKIFKFSSKCANFPWLLFGKREFILYTPLIDKLKGVND